MYLAFLAKFFSQTTIYYLGEKGADEIISVSFPSNFTTKFSWQLFIGCFGPIVDVHISGDITNIDLACGVSVIFRLYVDTKMRLSGIFLCIVAP